jgi:membrane-associated phospholipid phosphatase
MRGRVDAAAGQPVRRAWFVAGLSGAAVLCAATFVLVYRLAVLTVRGRTLDGAALRGALLSRSRLTDLVERVLDVVSVTALLAAGVLIAVIALVRLRHTLALAAIVMLAGANLSTQVLKRYVLDRPDLGLDEITPARLNSMPSGHSTVALSVAVALVMVLPAKLRPSAAVAGAVYASVTGIGTLLAGWHRPSDAVAGFLVVAVWASLVGVVTVLLDDTVLSPHHLETHAPTARHLGIAAAGLLALAALVAGLLLATTDTTSSTPARLLAYLAGSGAVAGTAAAVMAGLLVAVPRIAPRSQRAAEAAAVV